MISTQRSTGAVSFYHTQKELTKTKYIHIKKIKKILTISIHIYYNLHIRINIYCFESMYSNSTSTREKINQICIRSTSASIRIIINNNFNPNL